MPRSMRPQAVSPSAGSSAASNQTTNSAANEHKHPNQYTKGADDESAKNSVNSRSAKNSR